MDATDLAWAAGFIDGDGSISVSRQRQRGAVSVALRVTSAGERQDVERQRLDLVAQMSILNKGG